MNGSWHRYRPGERWRRPPSRARLVIEVPGAVAVCFDAPVVELLEQRAEAHPPVARRARAGPALAPDFDADEARPPPARPSARRDADRRGAASTSGRWPGSATSTRARSCGSSGSRRSRPSPTCRRRDARPARRDGPAAAARQRRRPAAAPERVTTAGDRGAPGPLYVYGRTGRPCRRCRTPIASARQGRDMPRPTYWCPACQAGPAVSEIDVRCEDAGDGSAVPGRRLGHARRVHLRRRRPGRPVRSPSLLPACRARRCGATRARDVRVPARTRTAVIDPGPLRPSRRRALLPRVPDPRCGVALVALQTPSRGRRVSSRPMCEHFIARAAEPVPARRRCGRSPSVSSGSASPASAGAPAGWTATAGSPRTATSGRSATTRAATTVGAIETTAALVHLRRPSRLSTLTLPDTQPFDDPAGRFCVQPQRRPARLPIAAGDLSRAGPDPRPRRHRGRRSLARGRVAARRAGRPPAGRPPRPVRGPGQPGRPRRRRHAAPLRRQRREPGLRLPARAASGSCRPASTRSTGRSSGSSPRAPPSGGSWPCARRSRSTGRDAPGGGVGSSRGARDRT